MTKPPITRIRNIRRTSPADRGPPRIGEPINIPLVPSLNRSRAALGQDHKSVDIVPIMRGVVPDWKATAADLALKAMAGDEALAREKANSTSDNAAARRNAQVVWAANNFRAAVERRGWGLLFLPRTVVESYGVLVSILDS